jgi:multimeric flavodoxin WrbA
MNVLIVSASPRRNGNSRLLAESALEGAREAGHDAELVQIDDYVTHFLRDCRQCRDADGRCTIPDRYPELLREQIVPADGVIYATPIYWYGMAGQLKTYFDRLFCFIAASEPESELFVNGVVGKRIGLLMSSEETYPGAGLGIVHQIQEYSRYTHSEFVGYVCGIGNKRGDVLRDPNDPIGQARALGRTLFDRVATDYRIDTERAGSTWATLGADI